MAVKLSLVVLVITAFIGTYSAPIYKEDLFDAKHGTDTECTGVSVVNTLPSTLLHDCATQCSGLSGCLAFNWATGNTCTLLGAICGSPTTGVTGTTYYEKL